MFDKKYLKIFTLILLGLAVAFCMHSSYRGANPWPMHTEDTIELYKKIKNAGLGKIDLNYRAMQVLEVKCTSKDWTEPDVEKVLDIIQELLQDDNFQKSYAQKYAQRYDIEVTASRLKAVVVYFLEKDENLPITMYTSSEPFCEWYQP